MFDWIRRKTRILRKADEFDYPYKTKMCVGECGKEIYVLPNHIPICDECFDKQMSLDRCTHELNDK